MATLEKIRKRSVLLFIVIIGALLAFILGDFLTSGRSFFGPGDTVAKANGAKVDYNTFNESRSKINSDNNQVDPAMVDADVINNLLLEKLMDEQYDDMGIKISDEMIARLMFDAQSPYAQGSYMMIAARLAGAPAQADNQVMQMMAGQGAQLLASFGIIDTKTAYDALENPKKYKLNDEVKGQLAAIVKEVEDDVMKGARQNLFINMLAGLFSGNKADLDAIYNERNTTTKYAYVSQDLSSIKDEDVKLTDADYQKYYDAHKGLFRITEETRFAKVIRVDVAPSAEDLQAAAADAQGLYNDLQTMEVRAAQKKHGNFLSNSGRYNLARLANAGSLSSFIAPDSTGSVNIQVGDVRLLPTAAGSHAMAKVTGKSNGIDKVKFGGIGIPASADSIFKNLTVETFDSIATLAGGRRVAEVSLIDESAMMDTAMVNRLKTQALNQVVFDTDTVTDQEGKKQVVKYAYLITERDEPADIFDITTLSYTVTPSSKTISDLNSKLNAYIAKNGNAEAFGKNAEKSGYTVVDLAINAQTPALMIPEGSENMPYTRDTRKIIKWIMENDKDDVSKVFSVNSNKYIIAAAIAEEHDDDYLPVTSAGVRKMIEGDVKAQKRADMLIEKIGKHNTLAEYSSAMGTPVANAQSSFGEQLMTAGALALQGVVAGAEKGKIVGPFLSGNAVYVIQVNDRETSGLPKDNAKDNNEYIQKTAPYIFSQDSMLRMLVGDNEIENNILEFTGDAQ